jgi:hypothetical protein
MNETKEKSTLGGFILASYEFLAPRLFNKRNKTTQAFESPTMQSGTEAT